MSIDLTARNATLADMLALLNLQEEAKHDGVVPAQAIRSVGGTLVVAGMGDDGPAGEPGLFQPTAILDGHLADKLGVPVKYLRRLRDERIDLYDANVNGWLQGNADSVPPIDPDTRKFLLRTFRDTDGGVGVARALVSDRYGVIDNLDMATAIFQGIRDTGIDVAPPVCDLTETRMTIKIEAPEVQALAPTLLRGYRSPYSGQTGDENPTVFAGLLVTNSETGGGAYTIVPRLVVQICRNGMVMRKDAIREVHLGGQLSEGVVRWSGATHQQNLDLVAAKTRDAVATFLDVDYMTLVLDRLEEKAERKIDDPAKAVELVGTQLRYTEEQRNGILNAFIDGGQRTAGGVLHAITAYAQQVEDPDAAFDLENTALAAFDLVAA